MELFLKRVFTTKTRSIHLQFIRYGFVSVAALALDFGLLIVLKQYAHFNYLVATSISFIAGLLLNYALSTFWVFHSSKILNKHTEFIVFGIVGVIGLGLTDLIMWLLTSGLGLFYVFSKTIATVIVYFWNFGARKKYLFN